jgi:PAS domain S-box-containing protein
MGAADGNFGHFFATGRKRRRVGGQFVILLMLVVAGVACSAVTANAIKGIEERLAEEQFRDSCAGMASSVQSRIDRNFEVVEAIAAVFVAREDAMSRQEFHRFVGKLLVRHPDLQALEWIPRVPGARRAEYEAKARGDGFSAFQFNERTEHGRTVAAAERGEYFPVYFVEPLQGNEAAVGFDLASNAKRREAIVASRTTGMPMATGRITLVQETGSQYGLLLFQPIFAAATGDHKTAEEDLQGFVLGVFRVGDMIDYALGNFQTAGAAITLNDLAAAPAERVLYRSPSRQTGIPSYRVSLPLRMPGREWTLDFESTPAFESIGAVRLAWGVLAGGILTTLFAVVYLRGQISRRIEKEAQAAALRAVNGDLEKEVAERRQFETALTVSEERLRVQIERMPIALIVFSPDFRVQSWNPAAERMFGFSAEEACGRHPYEFIVPEAARREVEAVWLRLLQGDMAAGSVNENITKDGRVIVCEWTNTPLLHGDGGVAGVLSMVEDVTVSRLAEAGQRAHVDDLTRANAELHALNRKLEQAQSQLLQSEKMASIGMLAAGVAHEINNPVGFIKSNMQPLGKYIDDLLHLIDAYEKVEAALPEHRAAFREVHEFEQNIDFKYEKQDVTALLSESTQGIERVIKIVQDLKDFSRMDRQETWAFDDLHNGIDSTLNVIWNELKYKCEVRKEYGELPPVECVLPQMNQVFMNLLVNAAQAITDHGVITIRTGTRDERVWIEIADTGGGIAPENLSRVFDPFYTTKPVGQGTGLGLSVSYSIVEKHHGRIEVESQLGKGTTFRIWLPLSQSNTAAGV